MYSFKIDLIQFNISELVENYDFIKPDDKPIAPGNFFLHTYYDLANEPLKPPWFPTTRALTYSFIVMVIYYFADYTVLYIPV